MKTGIKFSFNAVVAGQKSATVNAEPQLIANSTQGKFSVTSVVSKALNVAVGENIMFINNIGDIESNIQAKNPEYLAVAEEQGFNLETAEGVRALVDYLTVWAIAKGYKKVDAKGNPIMTSLRYSKEDKQKYINEHKEELVNAAHDVLVERNGGQDADVDTLAALITVDDIESPKVEDAEGSRTATTGSATGVGCPLNFTDTATWNTLKAGLDDKTKVNRVFNVLLDEPINISLPNGNRTENIVAYPIEFAEDAAPMVRTKNESAE